MVKNEQTGAPEEHLSKPETMILPAILVLALRLAIGGSAGALPAAPSVAETDAGVGPSTSHDTVSAPLPQDPVRVSSTKDPGSTAAAHDPQEKKDSSGSQAPASPVGTPHGKKLVLRDGSFQVIRSYEKHGDRVRYFSIERGEWEEIPASMVDWDATKKAEAADEKTSAALLEKAHIQAEAAKIAPPLEVDASLTVAQGVFLPEGEGMFVLEGNTIKPLTQAGSQVKTDKKTVLKQVLIPLPVVPGKKNIELPGTRAALRVTTATPEFYLREPPPDPDRASSVERTGRQNESGPDVLLIRAKVKGNKRYLASMMSLMGQNMGEEREEISVQRWEVAPDVYRFTLSEPLPPGEYALAEILDEGVNLFVWDFGVDGAAASPKQSGAPK